MLFTVAKERFLQDCIARGLSPKTRLRYENDLDRLYRFASHRGIAHLEELSVDVLRSFFANLQDQPHARRKGRKLSAFTVEGIYRSIKTFFVFCRNEHYIGYSPMDHIRRMKLPKRIVPRLSEDQVAELIELIQKTKSPERNFALVLLMVDSGLRRGEALGLRLGDINLTEGTIKVMGKGSKEREVPLGKASKHALRGWLKIRHQNGTDTLFVNEDGSPFQADGVHSLFIRMRKRLGVERLYPHLLRHTFAKLYLKNVHDVKSLQQVLGHSRASTTLDLYVEYDLEDLKEIHRRGSPVDMILRKKKRFCATDR